MNLNLLFASAALALGLAVPVFATSQTGPLLVTVSTSPNPYAIRGNTSVSQSAGVLGYASGATDVGLEGYATAAGSVGLEGFAQSTSGTASNGVFGYAANGSGVYGAAGSAASFGVTAATNATNGTALQAISPNGTGISASGQVFGVSGASTDGDGVIGMGSGSADANGVLGDADAGIGVEAVSTSGTALSAMSTSGNGIVVQSGAYPFIANNGSKDVASLDSSGDLLLAGTFTELGTPHSVVRDSAGTQRLVYGTRATQATLEDYGTGNIRGGVAEVALDPAFARTLDPQTRYLVFFTSHAPVGVWLSRQSATTFEARAMSGRDSFTFDYRIVGYPRAERPQPRLAEYHSALDTMPRVKMRPIPVAHHAAVERPHALRMPAMPVVIDPRR